MRSSSKGLKSTMLQKKLSNSGLSTLQQQSQMNKTQLSSLSQSSQKNQDKLSQLKQKLQKERQTMRKTGKRFKDNVSSTSNEIQIQTDEREENIKPVTNSKLLAKTTKVSTGIGSSTAAGLFDFGSIKAQVQNRTNKVFMKKNLNQRNQPLVPTYTTQQIINSVSSKKSLTKQQKPQQSKYPQQKPFVPCQSKRQTVNLMQLSTVIQKSPQKTQSTSKQQQQPKFFDITKTKKPSQKTQNLANSRLFDQAFKQQKERNKQVEGFLKKVGLEEFTEEFIRMGFDQVQTLIEVQVDELNEMKMRARQQDKLMKFIKEFKIKNNLDEDMVQSKPLVDRPSAIHSRLGYRPKSAALTTEPSQNTSVAQNSRLRSTTQNFNMSQSTFLSKSSIFYSMGGSQWSLQSQIRKACSGCFKVSYDAVKRGDCYYCENCDPGEFDEIEISLDQSMVKEYW